MIALAVLIATGSSGPGALAATPPLGDVQIVPGFGADGGGVVRVQSGYEQTFNPFGDHWDTKGAANPSIPVGLTPACYKRTPKSGIIPPTPPNADEVAFLAKSNSPIVWEECADVMDASGPDIAGNVGDVRIKANIAALKAANPNLKYIGYLALPKAETQAADGSAAQVGLNFIHRNRETWFVHTNGTDPNNAANRVKFIETPSEVYDVTNADFRAFMVERIVESLQYHNMDGFVVDKCFDLPETLPATPAPPAVIANWQNGCLTMLQQLKDALEPLGKLVFFTGYLHRGSESQGSAINDAASELFYQQRLDRTHGFYWEDPLRAVTARDLDTEFSVERLKRNRDYAVQRGKYFVQIINTNHEGQSTFQTTNRDQQQYLARYFLAGYLAATLAPAGLTHLTVLHQYTPIAQGNQFYSAAFWKEWNAQLGSPLAADTRPASVVYQREFQNGRVVFNGSSNPFNANLSDGTWVNIDGQVQPASVVVPPKSGAIFLRPQETVTCTPRSPVTVAVTNLGGGQIQAVLRAGTTGGSLRSIEILETNNAIVDIENGASNVTGRHTHTPAFGTTSVRLNVRRAGSGAMTVPLNVTDGCGGWRTLVGGGTGI